MDLEQLTPEQQAIYWEVKEWYPAASHAALIASLHLGLEALINQCSDGTIPQDDVDEEVVAADIAKAIQLSMRPAQQQQQQLLPQQHNTAHHELLHVGEVAAAAPAAAYPLQQQKQHLLRPLEQVVLQQQQAAPPAAYPADAQHPCAICGKRKHPTARCHWPINKAFGDQKEEDPRAHACCGNCITTRYMFKRIQVTSRVAIACLAKDCEREIHQDRLVADAQLKPALAQWMLGNTDVTVGNARFANTVKELKRKREEEPEISDEDRERLTVIIDHMDHDKFTYLVDMLPDVDFAWLLENVDRGSVFAILDQKEQDDTVPKRRRRRADKKGVTHFVEERLRLETTFDCGVCFEEAPCALGVPCLRTGAGAGDASAAPPHEQHLFCGACVRGHAAAAVEQASIVRAGLGLKCMQPECAGVLIYAHIEPLVDTRNRALLEERIAAEALAAAAVNVERCQRCPFAAIVDEPIEQQQTFGCERCRFVYCRNCNREWSARHEGKRCEELNPEFIRRKVENALSDGSVGVLQRCPQCHVAFEKNGGCNTMHCRCGKAFPYAGVKEMSQQQRAAIIQQHLAEAGGDDSVADELNKIK